MRVNDVEPKPEIVGPETAEQNTEEQNTAGPDVDAAPVEAPEPAATGSRRPPVVLAGVAGLLLVTAGVFAGLFVTERSARDDAVTKLRAEAARAAGSERDLADVRAQRAALEAKLSAAEAAKLSPEAITAIKACVNLYAELEGAAKSFPPPPGGGSGFYALRSANGEWVHTCADAQPHLPK